MKALPALTLKKKVLDMHMNIATNLFKIIQERQLDVFFALEESLNRQNKTSILQVINDLKKDAQDKLRLFILYYLSTDEISRSDMVEYEMALERAGCDLGPLHFIKK